MSQADVGLWPDSAVSSIRRARQLSADKLPSAAIARDGRKGPRLCENAASGVIRELGLACDALCSF
jgi:hypothetical protein